MLHFNQTIFRRFLPYAIIFLCVLNTSIISSQTAEVSKDLFKWFDDNVGLENTGIYNGIVYKEKYRTKEGDHQFLGNSNFVKGSIVYNDQVYHNLDMKYDIHEDVVIIKPIENEFFTIQLVSDKVKSFSLGDQNFIRIKEPLDMNSTDLLSGFYKINFLGNQMSLFEKIIKTRKNTIGNKVTYSSFSEEREFYIYSKKDYHKISSKKRLIKLLPELKGEINSYYKLNNSNLKKDPERFMTGLIKLLNKSITR